MHSAQLDAVADETACPAALRVGILTDDEILLRRLYEMLAETDSPAFEPAGVALDSVQPDAFDALAVDLDDWQTRGTSDFAPWAELTAVVLLCSEAQEQQALEALNYGVQDYLYKQALEARELRRVLGSSIQRKQNCDRMREDCKRLSNLDRLKSNFVAVVSHELRTPLTPIKIYLSLLKKEAEEALSPEAAEYIGLIDRNVTRLSRLVSGVLDVTRIESGLVQMNPSAVDLGALAREITTLLQPIAREKKSSLSLRLEGDMHLCHCDGDMIRQAIMNLASNALLHTPAGTEVSIEVASTGGQVRIGVRDNGPGIPPEAREHLFEPYARLWRARPNTSGGLGLGLSIARGLLQAHGSGLLLDNNPGQGAHFWFELPAMAMTQIECCRRREWTLPRLKLFASQYGSTVQLAFDGEIMTPNTESVITIACSLLEYWGNRLVLDLTRATAIESRGVGCLIELRALALECGGNLCFLNPTGRVRTSLQQLGLLDNIPTFGNLWVALAAMDSAQQQPAPANSKEQP